MSQNSIVIPDGSGAAVLAAINNALNTLATDFSGPAEPSPTYAYMRWSDTTNNLRKIRNAANSAWITLGELLSNSTPVGEMRPFAGSSAPTGFLLCDGSAVSRTTYAALFAVVSTTYGVGDGSTTFNVPDVRGRALIGAGQGTGLTNRALGATGGAETHALTAAEGPTHNHGVTDPEHVHSVPLSSTAGGGTMPVVTSSGTANWSSNSGTASTGITVNNTGGGGSHNNMQPFLAVNYIIKS